MINYETQMELVKAAAKQFPSEFGLRAFPGEVFRINIGDSYYDETKGLVMLYVGIRKGDQWPGFSKGTTTEIRMELTALPKGALA